MLGTRVENINETIYEQIGIVTDQSGVYERLTVYANLHYFAKILRVDAARIEELLKPRRWGPGSPESRPCAGRR